MGESLSVETGGVLGVLALALLLGARHALDPDHLAAVTQIVLGDRRRGLRRSGIVGLSWGLGHALTLCLLGLPLVLYGRHLPEALHRGAELTVGVLIVVLALRLLVRWRDGELGPVPALAEVATGAPAPESVAALRLAWEPTAAAHRDAAERQAHTGASAPGRTPLAAFGVGLVHGVGGSAGVGVLAVASLSGPAALATLLLFAAATAVSMGASALAFGYLVTRGPLVRSSGLVLPALALAGATFGVWYTASVVLEAVAPG